MQQIMFASLAAGGGGYVINGSGTFDGTSGYLSRTPSGASNRTTWTFHVIAKRFNSSGDHQLFEAGSSSGTRNFIQYNSAGQVTIASRGPTTQLNSTALFRDPSAWQDLLFVWDTSDGTAADRVKVYSNGVRLTDFATDTQASSSLNSIVNTAIIHTIGRASWTAANFGNYALARVALIDGQALTPSSFGETTDDGYWQINDISGLTFGTNGFLLEGQNLSTGTDSQAGGTPAEQQIQALFHMDGSDAATSFTDNSTYGRTWAAGGNAQLDTAIKKFGTASLLLDGTGDDVAIANDATWMDIATQNFTMDCWVYFTAVANNQTFISKWTGSGNQRSWNFAMNGTSGTPVLEFQCTANGSTTVTVSESWSPSATTWYHVAVERTGGKIHLYVDGTMLGSGTSNTTDLYTGTAEIAIGTLNAGAAEPFAGNIDEVRIVIGTGVYGGSNFTAASAAYANPATANHFAKSGTITATNDSPTNGDA